MKKIISSIAIILCLSCSGGDDSNKDSCSTEIPIDLQRDINDANINLFSELEPQPLEPVPTPQPYLSKPSGSVVAESKSDYDVVVCKEIVEAEKNRIENQIRDACNIKYQTQAEWCTSQVIKYAQGIDPDTGTPIPDMDKQRAIAEGRPLWILESIKTR